MSSHDCSFLFNALDALSGDTSEHVRKYHFCLMHLMLCQEIHLSMSGSTSDMLRYIQVACSDIYK